MTCIDVMYQALGAGCHAYPRETAGCPRDLASTARHGKLLQVYPGMQEPLDLGPSSSFTPAVCSSSSSTSNEATFAPSATLSSSSFPALPACRSQRRFYSQQDFSTSTPTSPSSTPSSSSADIINHYNNNNKSINNNNNNSINHNYNHSQHQHHNQEHHLHHDHHRQQQKQKQLQTNNHTSRQMKDETCKREAGGPARDSGPVRTEYLGANCVLHTFFSGDVRTAVDDHFTRSMENQGQQQRSHGGVKATGSIPLVERNFPPSFWNSFYYQQHPHYSYHNFLDQSTIGSNNYSYNPHYNPFHHFGAAGGSNCNSSSSINDATILSRTGNTSTGAGATAIISGSGSASELSSFSSHPSHAYLSPALHGLSNLQTAAAAAAVATTDPWSAYCNSLASPASAVPYPHRPVPYDLSGYSSSGRFGQNYSSFFMQPSSMRSAHFGGMTGHCDVTKGPEHAATTRSRYNDSRLCSEYTSGHHSSLTAIDASSLQDATKDLYWF